MEMNELEKLKVYANGLIIFHMKKYLKQKLFCRKYVKEL